MSGGRAKSATSMEQKKRSGKVDSQLREYLGIKSIEIPKKVEKKQRKFITRDCHPKKVEPIKEKTP